MIGDEIAERVRENLIDLGLALEAFTAALPCTTAWIQRDWQQYRANPAHALLTSTKIALLEAGTSWAIGSNRGAATSIRVALENAFAWLFYKDHPVEYRAVKRMHAELLLPKAVQQNLKLYDLGYEQAYKMLDKVKKRPNEYYYSDVSGYVHANPSNAIGINIGQAVIACPRDQDFLALCKFADEFVSDNYLTHYRTSWGDFPVAVQEACTARLGESLSKFVEHG